MLCQSTGPELAGKALEEKKIVQHLISSTEVGHGAWGKDGLAASAWVLNFLNCLLVHCKTPRPRLIWLALPTSS